VVVVLLLLVVLEVLALRLAVRVLRPVPRQTLPSRCVP